MTSAAEMIVLHTTASGEKSLVLHTISRRWGRKGFFVRNAGRHGMTSMFLPMSILEADVTESPVSTLFNARNFVCRHPLAGIRGNLYKNSMTMFLSEVLYRVVREGLADEEFYDWCVNEILLLDALQSDFANFHIRFLIELASVLGFAPDSRDLEPFAGANIGRFDRFLQSSFEESMLIPLAGEVRSDMAESLLRYIEHHTEASVNVNSLKVLRELFSSL